MTYVSHKGIGLSWQTYYVCDVQHEVGTEEVHWRFDGAEKETYMEGIPLSLIATVSGFAVAGGMSIKLLSDLSRAWIRGDESRQDYLQLYVNGKDFSVDLKTISNGGSETIEQALQELERCA